MEKEIKSVKEIERSIIKTYRNCIWYDFIKALKEYNMLKEGCNVRVLVDFTKETVLLAMLFKELLRHSDFEFTMEVIVLDKYSEYLSMLDYLNIEYKVVSEYDNDDSSLVALSQTYDNQIEETLENMLFNHCFKTIIPKEANIIRPLYQIRLKDINRWANFSGLSFREIKLSDNVIFIRGLLQELESYNINSQKNIFKSVNNIYVHKILGYYKDGVKHSFLEDF